MVLFVGVNGSGKTTSIAKFARYLKGQGHSVLLAACDTYRAAAVEQLSIWADRLSVDIVKQPEGTDPAAVAFDAAAAAASRGVDFLLVDTAGRLHTREDLMRSSARSARSSTSACPVPRTSRSWCWTPPPARTRSVRPSSSSSTRP